MSVRDCLLAILTLGPQYGLQLHTELATRTPHRAATNVGQIYSTLERLVRDTKVETAGQTDDGLPLYRLTRSGDEDARVWLSPMAIPRDTSWPDILDLIFMVRSLPHVDTAPAFDAVDESFADLPIPPSGSEPKARTASLMLRAEQDFARCVRDVVTLLRDEGGTTAHGWSLSNERPKRGRKPLNR